MQRWTNPWTIHNISNQCISGSQKAWFHPWFWTQWKIHHVQSLARDLRQITIARIAWNQKCLCTCMFAWQYLDCGTLHSSYILRKKCMPSAWHHWIIESLVCFKKKYLQLYLNESIIPQIIDILGICKINIQPLSCGSIFSCVTPDYLLWSPPLNSHLVSHFPTL